MELLTFQQYPWDIVWHPSLFMSYLQVPENYVQWRETPECHIYSADLPGVRKEEIKVEVEDSKYLIIRTETINHSADVPQRRFMRKFRLPGRVEIDRISAGYEDGVLTVTVPRTVFFIDTANLAGTLEITATARAA